MSNVKQTPEPNVFLARQAQKHDLEANWEALTDFKPKNGEIIVYEQDDNYKYPRMKIGDGENYLQDLPFIGNEKQMKMVALTGKYESTSASTGAVQENGIGFGTCIVMHNKQTCLVFDFGSDSGKTLFAYLNSDKVKLKSENGKKVIDAIFISHYHEDHWQKEALELLVNGNGLEDGFIIKNLILPHGNLSEEGEIIEKNSEKWEAIKNGDLINLNTGKNWFFPLQDAESGMATPEPYISSYFIKGQDEAIKCGEDYDINIWTPAEEGASKIFGDFEVQCYNVSDFPDSYKNWYYGSGLGYYTKQNFNGFSVPLNRFDYNGFSMVNLVKFFGHTIAITGDINPVAVERVIEPLSRAEIIVIPHHGLDIRFPPSCFNKLNAKHAIICSAFDASGYSEADLIEDNQQIVNYKYNGALMQVTRGMAAELMKKGCRVITTDREAFPGTGEDGQQEPEKTYYVRPVGYNIGTTIDPIVDNRVGYEDRLAPPSLLPCGLMQGENLQALPAGEYITPSVAIAKTIEDGPPFGYWGCKYILKVEQTYMHKGRITYNKNPDTNVEDPDEGITWDNRGLEYNTTQTAYSIDTSLTPATARRNFVSDGKIITEIERIDGKDTEVKKRIANLTPWEGGTITPIMIYNQDRLNDFLSKFIEASAPPIYLDPWMELESSNKRIIETRDVLNGQRGLKIEYIQTDNKESKVWFEEVANNGEYVKVDLTNEANFKKFVSQNQDILEAREGKNTITRANGFWITTINIEGKSNEIKGPNGEKARLVCSEGSPKIGTKIRVMPRLIRTVKTTDDESNPIKIVETIQDPVMGFKYIDLEGLIPGTSEYIERIKDFDKGWLVSKTDSGDLVNENRTHLRDYINNKIGKKRVWYFTSNPVTINNNDGEDIKKYKRMLLESELYIKEIDEMTDNSTKQLIVGYRDSCPIGDGDTFLTEEGSGPYRFDPSLGGYWIVDIFKTSANYAVIEARTTLFQGSVLKRIWNKKENEKRGTLQPWEWEAPRLSPFVEYRTTKRFGDKPVYKKRIYYDDGNFETSVDSSKIADYRVYAKGLQDVVSVSGLLGGRHPLPYTNLQGNIIIYKVTQYVNNEDSEDKQYETFIRLRYIKTGWDPYSDDAVSNAISFDLEYTKREGYENEDNTI